MVVCVRLPRSALNSTLFASKGDAAFTRAWIFSHAGLGMACDTPLRFFTCRFEQLAISILGNPLELLMQRLSKRDDFLILCHSLPRSYASTPPLPPFTEMYRDI